MAENQVIIELLLANNQYLAKLTESQQKTNSAVKNMASSFSSMGGIIAGSAVFKALEYMVEKAEAAEHAQEKLNLRIKSTEGIAGVTAAAINKYSEELTKTSVYGKTALTQMSTDLLKFTNIHTNEFKGAMQAVVDYASETGDLSSAAQVVGRALQNPANAARALRAANITLSTEQQNLINKFIKTGDVASAQGIILKKFTQIYGGQALLDAQSYDGALAKMKNTMNALIAEGSTPLMHSITDLFTSTNKFTENSGISIFAEAVKAALAPMKLFIDYAAGALDLINKLYDKWEKFRGLNVTAFDSVMKSTPKGGATAGAYDIVSPKGGKGGVGQIHVPKADDALMFGGIIAAQAAAEKIKEIQKELDKAILSGDQNAVKTLTAQMEKLREGLSNSLKSIVKDIASFAEQWGSNIVNLLNAIDERAIRGLEKKKTEVNTIFDFMEQRALESAGVQEQTAAQAAGKELSELQKRYTKTASLMQRKNLREQILEKQKEKKKLDIQEESQKRKQALDIIMDLFEMQMKRRQFERNKAYQLSMVWINTAAAITAAWLSAWTLGFPPLAIAMGAISTALLLANAAIQTATISQQQAPAFEQGSWDVQSTGPAILHGGEIVTPQPMAESIRAGEAYLGAGSSAGPTIIMNHVYDKRGVAKVLKDVFGANNFRLKTVGAY